jgi:hypothetical protein
MPFTNAKIQHRKANKNRTEEETKEEEVKRPPIYYRR